MKGLRRIEEKLPHRVRVSTGRPPRTASSTHGGGFSSVRPRPPLPPRSGRGSASSQPPCPGRLQSQAWPPAELGWALSTGATTPHVPSHGPRLLNSAHSYTLTCPWGTCLGVGTTGPPREGRGERALGGRAGGSVRRPPSRRRKAATASPALSGPKNPQGGDYISQEAPRRPGLPRGGILGSRPGCAPRLRGRGACVRGRGRGGGRSVRGTSRSRGACVKGLGGGGMCVGRAEAAAQA